MNWREATTRLKRAGLVRAQAEAVQDIGEATKILAQGALALEQAMQDFRRAVTALDDLSNHVPRPKTERVEVTALGDDDPDITLYD